MTLQINNSDNAGYTQIALTEQIKQEMARVVIDREEYLSKIRESKRNRSKDQNCFDYELELDFSIDLENPDDVARKFYDDRWYYYKAHQYLKIGIFKKTPSFKISLSHLSPKIISELKTFDLNTRQYILKMAVAKIFEDINVKLYHDSVSSRLEVILVK